MDSIAHGASLDAGGRTIAVLGSGVDYIYPPEHSNMADEIILHGAVISDYLPGTPPDGINFPQHNRIISGCRWQLWWWRQESALVPRSLPIMH